VKSTSARSGDLVIAPPPAIPSNPEVIGPWRDRSSSRRMTATARRRQNSIAANLLGAEVNPVASLENDSYSISSMIEEGFEGRRKV
jgi:hypothetical protein